MAKNRGSKKLPLKNPFSGRFTRGIRKKNFNPKFLAKLLFIASKATFLKNLPKSSPKMDKPTPHEEFLFGREGAGNGAKGAVLEKRFFAEKMEMLESFA